MCKNAVKISIFLVAALLTAGCWDSTDIESKDITTAVLIDKNEEGYALFLEIAFLAGSSGGDGGQGSVPRSQVITAIGPSFVEARKALDRQSDQSICLSSVQSVIFTENILYSGIEEYMYRFRQNPEYRKTSMVVATGEKPEDLFSAASEHNTLVGRTINDTVDSLVDEGQLYHFDMGDVLEVMSCPCKGYLIPRVSLKNQDIAIDGFCVMHDGVCHGYIPIDEGVFIGYVRGNVPPFRYAMPYEENSITVEIRLKKQPTEIAYSGGEIKIGLDFICQANLLYMDDDFPVDESIRQDIGEKLEQRLTEEFKKVIATSQKVFQIDYLKLHEAFRIHYPDEYYAMDWNEEYPKADISVNIKVTLGGSNIDYEPEA